MLRAAQVCMAISIIFTGFSLYHTWGHGFSNDFFGEPYGPHAQFHAIREVFMAMGIVSIVGLLMYGPRTLRTPTNWWVMVIGSAFLTVGVWLSLPITDTSFPSLGASLNHIMNTLFATIALGLCWKTYHP